MAAPSWPVYVREGGGAAGLYLLLVSIPLKNLALCISWHDIEGKEGNNVTMYDYSDHEKEKPFSVSLYEKLPSYFGQTKFRRGKVVECFFPVAHFNIFFVKGKASRGQLETVISKSGGYADTVIIEGL